MKKSTSSHKVNLAYAFVYERRSDLVAMLENIIIMLSASPRMVLEVLLRRGMGERYFNFPLCVLVMTLFAVITYPLLSYGLQFNLEQTLRLNWSWYGFLLLCLAFGWRHHLQNRREPSVFDFGKFSLSSGRPIARLWDIPWFGKPITMRQISIYIEPLIGIAASLLVYLLGQTPLAILILSCSLIYSLSYAISYKMGDSFIMDQIDQIIFNEELYNNFVEQRRPEETRGVHFMANAPNAFDLRDQLVNQFIVETEEPAAKVS